MIPRWPSAAIGIDSDGGRPPNQRMVEPRSHNGRRASSIQRWQSATMAVGRHSEAVGHDPMASGMDSDGRRVGPSSAPPVTPPSPPATRQLSCARP